MRALKALIGICAAAVLLPAAELNVGATVSGFVYDSQARSIRPMLGRPGSAYLGGDLASGYTLASISPDGKQALAVGGGALYWIADLRGGGEPQLVEGIDGVSLVAWSADSAAAAVYAAGGKLAWRLRNGAAEAAFDLTALEGVTALALDKDSLVAGAAGGVYLAAEGAPRLLVQTGRAAGLTIRDADLYVADAARGEIWRIAGFAGEAAAELWAADLPGAAGIQFSANGKRAFVPTAETRSLAVLDAASHAVTARLDLEFVPDSATLFGDRSLVLLRHGGEGSPYWVLDTEAAAVYFVPAGRAE